MSLSQDIKHAFRHFRRSPGFAVAAVLTLALGIGANTAMFSVLNRLAIQRLSVVDRDGLYSLSSDNARGQKRYIPMPTVIDLNRESPFVEACGYNGGGIFPIEAKGIPTQGLAAFVTGRCFSVFGVRPVLGRGIVNEDAPIMTAGAKVVVISDRLWNRLFQRDPGAIGQLMRVDSTEAMAIGILPPGFRGLHVDSGIDVYAPPDSLVPATQGRRPVAQEVLGTPEAWRDARTGVRAVRHDVAGIARTGESVESGRRRGSEHPRTDRSPRSDGEGHFWDARPVCAADHDHPSTPIPACEQRAC